MPGGIDLRFSLSLSLSFSLLVHRIATVSNVRKTQAEKIISSNQRDESRADGTREAIAVSLSATLPEFASSFVSFFFFFFFFFFDQLKSR
jgi:hypothetical protein